ncbi:FAD-dependent oxidoreductase [Clostridia bacterium OttesenSCG-928-O13]|nr:FAD-dependent oxidoreductase [Clostridia bacterium OttesenSCG-928-O13]
MSRAKRAKKRLQAAFGGRVALEDRGHYVRLAGQLDSWDEVVKAGALAAKSLKGQKTVVNDICCAGVEVPPMETPTLRDDALEGAAPDVLIIGGGITGCAIARALSRYQLDVVLVDKERDVALHASSRNDGMVHPGIDLRKGSLKHKYNLAGNRMYDAVCRQMGVPFRRSGQYLCFQQRWLRPLLYCTLPYWRWLGLKGVKVLGRTALRAAEPNLDESLNTGLFFPSAGSVCPYNLTIAFAENAVENGAKVVLDTVVEGMEVQNGRITAVRTSRGALRPKVVVNAAGVFADDIAAMAQDRFYSIHPRKGTNAILDSKQSDAIANTIVASIGTVSTKTAHSKGGGIVRTVEDNILVGPDAVETFEKENFATSRESVAATFARQNKTVPALSERAIITYFTGVRAPTYEEDFVVQMGVETENLAHAAGIQSPGITAAPAIAAEIARLVRDYLAQSTGAAPAEKPNWQPVRKPIVKAAHLPDEERAALIAQNPDYGLVVCRCEEVSAGEICAALRRPVPCRTVDGVKRRVRPGMGRCQGGFCGPLVAQMIAQENKISLQDVEKSGQGSRLVFGPVKGVRRAED